MPDAAPPPPLRTAEQVAATVAPGARVWIGSASATPTTVLAALESVRSPPPDVEIVSYLASAPPGQPFAKSRYRHRVFFVGSDLRAAVGAGQADYVPVALEEVPGLLDSGRLRIDLAVVRTTPPDANGFVSLGTAVDLTPAVLATGCRAVAEIVPSMPRTHGESFVPAARFEALVEAAGPVLEYRHPTVADAVSSGVARQVAALIEDGSTLAPALGRLPNEVLRHLRDRRDLGFHGEAATDAVLDLLESGALTGARKGNWPGRVACTRASGSARLYAALHDNPRFAFLPIERLCDPDILAGERRLVALAQAFAVDLTGQVVLDHDEGWSYGGIGTAAAFLRAAARAAPGGKPLVCLPATTPDGAESNIRVALGPGAAVGLARADVHFVATEHGVAHLFGKSVRERALALIEIAAPAHRDALLAKARARGLVPEGQRLASQRGYPAEEERRLLLAGEQLLLRPTRASDARAVQGLFHRLSDEDRCTRFFARLRSLSQAEAERLCNVDHERSVAFVATSGPREAEEVVASGCYFLDPRSNLAEVACIVAPAWQGKGLGSALRARLGEYARAQGVRGFTASILPRNARMQRLAQGSGGRVSVERDEDELRVTMLFDAA